LALNGWVFIAVVVILSVTAWITAVQRILYVRRVALIDAATPLHPPIESASQAASIAPRRAQS
jgi:hypothetical protein